MKSLKNQNKKTSKIFLEKEVIEVSARYRSIKLNDRDGEEEVDEDWRSPSQLKSQGMRGPEPIYGFGPQQLAIMTFHAKKIRAKQLQLWCR